MTLNVDPQELRRLTDKAITEAEKKREEKLAQDKIKEERRQQEIVARAEKIIVEIPSICAKHAENGHNKATVMSLQVFEDYDLEKDHNREPLGFLHSQSLKGAAALVWKACEEACLNPSLDYWHDGEGRESGYNINVRW